MSIHQMAILDGQFCLTVSDAHGSQSAFQAYSAASFCPWSHYSYAIVDNFLSKLIGGHTWIQAVERCDIRNELYSKIGSNKWTMEQLHCSLPMTLRFMTIQLLGRIACIA